MVVPESVYGGHPSQRLADPSVQFWPGERPVVMRGSRDFRRWLHDRRYSIADGYQFDLRERWLRVHRITATSEAQVRAVWSSVTERIAKRYPCRGRKFVERPGNGWSYTVILDGKVCELSSGAEALMRVADLAGGVSQ